MTHNKKQLQHSFTTNTELTTAQAAVLGEYHYRAKFKKSFDQELIALKLNLHVGTLSRINRVLVQGNYIRIQRKSYSTKIVNIFLRNNHTYQRYTDDMLRECKDNHRLAAAATIVHRWSAKNGLSSGWELRLSRILGCSKRTIERYRERLMRIVAPKMKLSHKTYQRLKATAQAAFKRSNDKTSSASRQNVNFINPSNNTPNNYSENDKGRSSRDIPITDILDDTSWAT